MEQVYTYVVYSEDDATNLGVFLSLKNANEFIEQCDRRGGRLVHFIDKVPLLG
jgi:hypothetical protein